MDYYTILAQCSLLKKELTGRRIETIRIRDKYNLFVGFEGEQAVKLCSMPDMPYVILIEKKFIPVRNAHSWFSKYFTGSKVINISVSHGDRILTFLFDSGINLIFEMTGRHANIIAVNNEGVIVGAIRKVTKRNSGFRAIIPGIIYASPPAREFPDLVWTPLPEIERKLKSINDNIEGAIRSSLCSGSRLFALESLSQSGINPELYLTDLDSEETFKLLKKMASLVSDIENGGSGATIVFSKDGIPKDVFPMNMTAVGLSGKYMDDLNEAVKNYAREREIMLERRSLRNSIAVSLNREERSLRSTIMKVKKERGDESAPELLDRRGNTVLANLHKITKGMKSVMLDDPYGNGEIEIELDPTLDGPANAARIFSRAKKLRSAFKMSKERLKNLQDRIEEILKQREHAETIEEVKELKQIASSYERTISSKKITDFDEKFPRRFKSVSGLDIIVGRNDNENDELVRWANKNDYWLHAQNVGGSHVVLRSPGRQSPDHRSVDQASAIAAYYSKAKTSAIVPVVCTQVKYVVKRKGQGPGKVTYTREKVIFVRPGIPGEKGKT